MRRGFTLIELLVATAVFAVGFVSVFALFLAGMRFRKLSEDITRASLAASSLVSEIALDAGRDGAAGPHPPDPPSAYVGDGFVADASPADGATGGEFLVPYRAQPGIWYRVERCVALDGGDDPETTVLRLRVLVVPWATSDASVSLVDIARRLQLKDGGGTLISAKPSPADEIATELTSRGLALRTDAVITRRPSWMP
jgi:prepilin-type N-terminal cleavage/methylation domain-containing protein